MSDLQKIAGIGPARAAVLTAAGYGTPEAMAAAGYRPWASIEELEGRLQ